MVQKRWIVVAVAAGAIALAGCGAEAPRGAQQATPVRSSDAAVVFADPTCPGSPTATKAPQRVVTMDAGAAAFLIALGQGDKIVGTAAPDFTYDFRGDVRAKLDAIRVIDKKQGNAEAVLAAEPDFVTGISAYQFGKFSGTATVEQLRRNGASALAACDLKVEGPNTSLESTYRYIAALADVFDVTSRGDALIAQLRKDVAQASAPAKAKASSNVGVLILSSPPSGATGIMTSGGRSYANAIVATAGGRNVGGVQAQDFAKLSAEQVTKADPQVLVVMSGFSPAPDDQLKAAIIASPLVAQTTAVKTGNVVVVPQRTLLSPSLLNAQAVRTIADAVAAAK